MYTFLTMPKNTIFVKIMQKLNQKYINLLFLNLFFSKILNVDVVFIYFEMNGFSTNTE